MPFVLTTTGPVELIPIRPDTRTDAERLVDRQSGLIAAIAKAAKELQLMKPENRISGLARFESLTHEVLTAVIELREVGRDRAAELGR